MLKDYGNRNTLPTYTKYAAAILMSWACPSGYAKHVVLRYFLLLNIQSVQSEFTNGREVQHSSGTSAVTSSMVFTSKSEVKFSGSTGMLCTSEYEVSPMTAISRLGTRGPVNGEPSIE